MKKSAIATITTCMGVAAIGAAYMMSNDSKMNKKSKKLRRNAGRALHQVSSFIENASDMMR